MFLCETVRTCRGTRKFKISVGQNRLFNPSVNNTCSDNIWRNYYFFPIFLFILWAFVLEISGPLVVRRGRRRGRESGVREFGKRCRVNDVGVPLVLDNFIFFKIGNYKKYKKRTKRDTLYLDVD